MDAQKFDESRARRRRNLIIVGIVAALILVWVAYHLRDYPDRHAVNKFFSALEHQNLDEAYAIWYRDPDWKQHPAKYSNYTLAEFSQDWGPSSEWGAIKSYSVDCSFASGNGVIVQATVNHRTQHAYVWVQKSDRTLHFSPNEIECGNWFGWLTE
jgi:hypothetical protein